MLALQMNTIHQKGLMPIENFDHGRDATGPAENTIRNDSGTTRHNARDFPDTSRLRPGDEPEEPDWTLHLAQGNARIHAGKLYLADLAHALPVRLVKRIDQFALKVLRSPARRYFV